MRDLKPILIRGLILGLVWTAAVAVASWADSGRIDPGAPWPVYRRAVLPIPPGVEKGEIEALVAADLDRDGVRDLVVVWGTGEGSVVATYPATRSSEAEEAERPFGAPEIRWKTERRLAFAAVADMDGDGKADILTASGEGPELFWFTPEASGRPVLHSVPLPGKVTALAAVDWGRRDLSPDPVVGVEGPGGPMLTVFPTGRAPAGEIPVSLRVPGTVREIAAGNLDGDSWWDLAVAGDGGMVVVHGKEAKGTSNWEPSVTGGPFSGKQEVRGVATSRFLRTITHDVTVLGPAGFVLLDAKTGAVRQPDGEALRGAADAERFVVAWEGAGRGPAVVAAVPAGLELRGAMDVAAPSAWRAGTSGMIPLEGRVTQLVTVRANGDALDDLLFSVDSHPHPQLLLTGPRSTYTVTTTDDHDDGTCSTTDCTLREAIKAANAHAGPDQISTTGSYIFQITSELPGVTDTTTFDFNQQGYWYVDGQSAGGSIGLWIQGDSCMVHGLISENHQLDANSNKGVGILLFQTANTTVDDSMATACHAYGVELFDAIDCTVSATASGNLSDGFFVYRGLSGTTSGNTLDPVAARQNGGHGIHIMNAPDTAIGGTAASSGAVCSGNTGDGIRAEQSGVSGAFLGKVEATDDPSSPNTNGIVLDRTGNVTVGLSSAPSYIAGNHGYGIDVENTSVSVDISGVTVGFLSDGTAARNDTDGIRIYQSSNVTVDGCVVSNNGWNGIEIVGNSGHIATSNAVRNSIIGANPAGDTAAGNGFYGINLDWAAGNTIGLTGGGGYSNLIAANGTGGIRVYGQPSSGNVIQNNWIGISATGTPLGNQDHGIWIEDAPDNTIGPDNKIANTTGTKGEGVVVKGPTATGNHLFGNQIHDNQGLGIDLGADGLTPPDDGDTDEGPNHLMNQPELLTAESCGGVLYVLGQLRGAPSALTYTLEFSVNGSCDATGWGEGYWPQSQTFSVTVASTDPHHFRHEMPLFGAGYSLTALTTGPFGSTSEYSNCKAVTTGRPGDATADCALMADDLAEIVHAVTDSGYTPPGDPDADGNGSPDTGDLVADLLKIYW